MKMNLKMMGLGVLYCLLTTTVRADLLNVNPSYPQINFVSADPSSINYYPSNQMFTLSSLPLGIAFSGADVGSIFTSDSTIQIQLNTDGTMASGAGGFTVTGQFTHVDGGVTNTYSGVLLQGDVIAFGYADGSFVDSYDFRIHLTGGALMSAFSCGDNVAVTVVSETSSFTGDFTQEFHGSAKGLCGPEDTTPPQVTCPPLSQVVTTLATNGDGVSGFIVTYPDPVVTDNCDPVPDHLLRHPVRNFSASESRRYRDHQLLRHRCLGEFRCLLV